MCSEITKNAFATGQLTLLHKELWAITLFQASNNNQTIIKLCSAFGIAERGHSVNAWNL